MLILLTQPIDVIAIGVTWPIIVLKAKEVIAPHDTPFKRMAVPKSSAGIAQLRGPLVMKKTVMRVSDGKRRSDQLILPKLKSHVNTTNAQCALVLLESVGYTLIIAALIMKVTQRNRHPKICSGRRPSESMVMMQIEVPTKAMMALTAWNNNERLVDIPICEKICGLKYWIALTPVIWQLAWMAMTRMVRRRFGQPRKRSRYVVFFCERSSEIWNWMRSYSAKT